MKNSTTRTRIPAAAAHAKAATVIASVLVLAGCAGFSGDGGFGAVADETRAKLNMDVRWARKGREQAKVDATVASLLQHPLSADDAVQIALLNNPSLQASFEELGVSEADLVQAGRPSNPRFTLRRAASGAQYDIEQTLSFNVLSLFTAPFAHEIERRRFAQAQSAIVIAVVRLADETRQAFFASVAARESTRYLEQVRTAAEASAELARRMVTAGNWSVIDQAREQSFHADAVLRLTQARLAEESTRQTLLQLTALSAEQLRLADRLPELPQSIDDPPDVEGTVLANRIDLRLKRLQIDELARSLGLTRATRFVNVLDMGPARILQGARSQPYETGYEISLEIPIFDSGQPRVRRAEALYSQAVDRYAQAAIDARSQVRRAYAGYRAAFEIAKQQRDEVVPARKMVAAQNLLRYNASLISVFDLLSDARGQIESVADCIRSIRDFWIAKSALDTALLGPPSL